MDREEKTKISFNAMKIGINILTMSRIIGAVFIPFIMVILGPLAGVGAVVMLLLTDVIDGMLARKTGNQTFLGSILDASADKVLGIALAAYLVVTLSPLFILTIIGEVLIYVKCSKALKNNKNIQSSHAGKAKAWPLGASLGVGALLTYKTGLGNFLPHIISGLMLVPTVILQYYALKSYEFDKVNKDIDESAIDNITEKNTLKNLTKMVKIADKELELLLNELLERVLGPIPKNEINAEEQYIIDNLENLAIQKKGLLLQKKNITKLINNLVDTPYFLDNKNVSKGQLFLEYYDPETGSSMEVKDVVSMLLEENKRKLYKK